RLYQDYEGEVLIDNVNFKSINIHEWRNRCGGVLQDGTILNDTILKNIVLDDEKVNPERLHEVIRLTNLNEFINQTVLKLYTIIGKGGIGISGGQKQRILIARALYKNPDFIFFDEATNSLDTKNENEITHNINNTIAGKTTLIIAHRLSTVKQANMIIVLHKG